jgi:NAD(P)H-flavin reductase
MDNPFRPLNATLEKVIPETPNIRTFVLRPEKPLSFLAGQFVSITVPGFGEAPFTPSSSPAVKETFEVTVMKVGSVTERLHAMKGGETLGVRGPLGKCYPLDQYKGREVLILGGGVGLAPLRALLFALLQDAKAYKRIVVCYGAKTPQDIVYKELLKEWQRRGDLEINLTVDRGDAGWTGNVGVVTTLLDKVQVDTKEGVAVCCGPPIMMKFGTLKLKQVGYPDARIYLSMEKNMSCGVGMCGHCRIGPYYACKDGPVFTYDKIKDLEGIWE